MKCKLQDTSLVIIGTYSYYYSGCTSLKCEIDSSALIIRQKLPKIKLEVSIGLDTLSEENFKRTVKNLETYLKSENALRGPGYIK